MKIISLIPVVLMFTTPAFAEKIDWNWIRLNLSGLSSIDNSGVANLARIEDAVSITLHNYEGERDRSVLCKLEDQKLECRDSEGIGLKGFFRVFKPGGKGIIDLDAGYIFGSTYTYVLFQETKMIIVSRRHEDSE